MIRAAFVSVLLLVALAVVPTATPQQPQAPRTGTAVIGGAVVDAASGQPIRRAIVTATEQSGATAARTTVTADDGRFTFRALPAGRYLVRASKAAYLATAFGAKRVAKAGSTPTGQAIALRDGEQKTDATLQLTRGGVLTGTVRDGAGQPLRGVSVSAAYWMRSGPDGAKTLTTGVASATTDARGVYRIFGLPPGEFVAVARVFQFGPTDNGANDFEQTDAAEVRRILDRPASTVTAPTTTAATNAEKPRAPETPRRPTYGYAPLFYPGTVSALDAVTIPLAAGEERGGIDFRMQVVPQSRVSGSVIGLDGRPATAAFVQLMENSSLSGQFQFSQGYSNLDAQGQFIIRGVPPGTYTLEVRPIVGRPGTTGAPNAWGRTTIAVSPGDDARVTLTLQPALTVSGQLKLDSVPAAPVDFTRARVSLFGRANGMTAPSVSADGRFTISGLVPGEYRWEISLGAGPVYWFPKAGPIGDRDAVETWAPLTSDVKDASVILTTQVSEITGVIQDAAGLPATEYFLVIFPANRALWTWQSRRVAQARPASDGGFAFRNLPAGDYLLAAVTDLDPTQIQEPAFLSELVAASISIKLADGEKKRQDIRLK